MNMQPRTDNNSAPDNHVVDFGKFHNVSMGELFNLPELDQKFLGVFENDKYVPKITKDYAFNVSALRSILSFLYRPTDGDGLMLYGPFGCGKTSLIREILGRVKYPTLML